MVKNVCDPKGIKTRGLLIYSSSVCNYVPEHVLLSNQKNTNLACDTAKSPSRCVERSCLQIFT